MKPFVLRTDASGVVATVLGGGGAGERGKVAPSRLHWQEVEANRSHVGLPSHRERVPGSSVGYKTFQTLSSWQEIHTPA